MSIFVGDSVGASKINTIDLFADYGLATRAFSKLPFRIVCESYVSSLFIVYTASQSHHDLKYRKTSKYRNHFAMYTSFTSREIVIARAETSLQLQDLDVFIEYDHIILKESGSQGTFGNIDVCYDDIEFRQKKPDFFQAFELLCTGEWWNWDKGIILNGRTALNNLAIFVYYELHPTYYHSSDQQSTSENPPSTSALFTFDSLDSSALVPVNVLLANQKLDDVKISGVTIASILPSSHWLDERNRELNEGNITSFLDI